MKIKLLLSLLLIYSISAISQTKEEKEAKNFFWGEHDLYKNVNEIPAKWNNESAVIIYKNVNYDFHKFGKKVTYKSSIRKRVKLLDKAALDNFSEFSFNKQFWSKKGYKAKRKGDVIIGLKIIKPSGKEIEVDTKENAVEVDGETKVAIANLEVGDILDYYILTLEPFKAYSAFGFDPVETTLAEDYPIMDFKLFFETENDFFINFNSYNGAPELKSMPTEKKSFRRYSLEASNIEKYSTNRWFYPLVDLPSYKFQVYFARSGKFENRARAFLPKKESDIKKEVSMEEVKEHYGAFRGSLPGSATKGINKHFKHKIFKTDTEKVTAAYYYMRHHYFNQFIEDSYAFESEIVKFPITIDRKNSIIQSRSRFFHRFKYFLKEHDIKYETVLVKKRYDGTMDDLLIAENLHRILKVNTETPLYIDFYTFHKGINTLSPLVEGTKAYLFTRKKSKIDKIINTTIPTSQYTDNESKKNISVSFDNTLSTVSLSIENYYKGHSKTIQQNDRLVFEDYIYDDHKKFGTKPMTALVKTSKKNTSRITKKFKALKEKLKENQKEQFIKLVQIEFDIKDIEDYIYNIDDTGRYGFDTYFTFNESFKIKDKFIKKAGPNYIVEIGKLIGGQVDLTEKERKRIENIHMSYPRVFNYVIKFNIPEGYTVSGLDKLKKSVDNKTGAFISDAKIEGNILIITTSKQYKNNYEPNSNWPLVVNFLDAANQFTNEKILLKKK